LKESPKLSLQQTKVIKETLDPKWNEEFEVSGRREGEEEGRREEGRKERENERRTGKDRKEETPPEAILLFFQVPYTNVNKSLVIEVWDHDMVGAPDFLGLLEFSLAQMKVWQGTEQTLPLGGDKKAKGTLTFRVK
jgi:hypothetical protein